MSFDRGQFDDMVKAKHKESQAALMPMIRVISGAAPVMDKLVRTDEWARFCSYLQGMANRMAEARDAARAKMNDPAVLEHKDLLKLKFDSAEADAMFRAWMFAIALPAAIQEGADKAVTFITEFEAKNADTAVAKS